MQLLSSLALTFLSVAGSYAIACEPGELAIGTRHDPYQIVLFANDCGVIASNSGTPVNCETDNTKWDAAASVTCEDSRWVTKASTPGGEFDRCYFPPGERKQCEGIFLDYCCKPVGKN